MRFNEIVYLFFFYFSDFWVDSLVVIWLSMKQLMNIPRNIKKLKNLKNVHWLYTIKNFKLSAVRLQPSMDKNGRNDNYNKYKLTLKIPK